MLAADRSLLEINLKQSAIKLREKELNLYSENYAAMATQASVMAGFTTTLLIEIHISDDANIYLVNFFYICAVISICSNITCVSLSTITTVWGSSKALRGRDGSMDESVNSMAEERPLIFNSFAIGLSANLLTVAITCLLVMKYPHCLLGLFVVLYTGFIIGTNAYRIQKKFFYTEFIQLDDLTRFTPSLSKFSNLTSNIDLMGRSCRGKSPDDVA